MSAQDAKRRDSGTEAERLKRELAAVRQRLEDEVAYYRAQVETTRQRVESEQLREQAQEVARRRELEEELARAKVELRDVRERAERLRRRHEDLNRQYLQQEESARLSAEEQVAQTRATARAAWQSAEEELATMERELAQARRELGSEQERARQLEETVRGLQGLDEAGGGDREAALLDEIAALKKALSLSERSREQANKRAVRLAEKLVAIQAQSRPADAKAADPVPLPERARSGAGNPVPVDLSEANAVLNASQVAAGQTDGDAGAVVPADTYSLEADLADEFRLIQADTSLDRRKLERLEQHVQDQERRDAEREHAREREQRAARRPFPEGGHQSLGPESEAAVAPDAATSNEPPAPRRWPALFILLVLVALLGAGSAWFLGVFP